MALEYPDNYDVNRHVNYVAGSFATNGSSAIDAADGIGGKFVATRAGVGLVDIAITVPAARILEFRAQLWLDAATARDLQIVSMTQADDGTWTVQVRLVGQAPRNFVSAETTATGSAQNVAHGLGVAPDGVLVAMTEHPGTPDTGAFDVAEGTHTSTNVVLTVTANTKFKVLAYSDTPIAVELPAADADNRITFGAVLQLGAP